MRATSVAKHFEEDSGLDPMILRPIGFGKNYPIADNSTAEGRERNRRVELVIISRDSPLAQSDAVAGAVSGLFDAEVFEAESNGIDSIQDVLDPSDVRLVRDAAGRRRFRRGGQHGRTRHAAGRGRLERAIGGFRKRSGAGRRCFRRKQRGPVTAG